MTRTKFNLFEMHRDAVARGEAKIVEQVDRDGIRRAVIPGDTLNALMETAHTLLVAAEPERFRTFRTVSVDADYNVQLEPIDYLPEWCPVCSGRKPARTDVEQIGHSEAHSAWSDHVKRNGGGSYSQLDFLVFWVPAHEFAFTLLGEAREGRRQGAAKKGQAAKREAKIQQLAKKWPALSRQLATQKQAVVAKGFRVSPNTFRSLLAEARDRGLIPAK